MSASQAGRHWPGRLDVDPDVLIWDGPAPPDPAERPREGLILHRTPVLAEIK
jgi:hypothetical protein